MSSGFRGFREINTVVFDPERVSVAQMIAALKEAGTYIGMAQES